jgi:hypothetical protein
VVGATRRGIVTEVTVLVAARWRAAFDGIMTPQQRRSEAVARLSEHDGEKVVDGQAVLDLQRAGQDDGRSRAGGSVSGRVLAGTGSALKATVAGERDCRR